MCRRLVVRQTDPTVGSYNHSTGSDDAPRSGKRYNEDVRRAEAPRTDVASSSQGACRKVTP